MSNVNKRLRLGLAVAALVLCHSAARADQEQPEPILDSQFLADATTSGNAAVQLSKLAVEQADDAKVKAFAQKQIKERTALNDKIVDAGRGLKFGVDLVLEKEWQTTYDQLSKLQGADFDREYLKLIIDCHDKAVTLFEREAKTGTNADLKKVASDSLPKIKEHLKQARALRDGLKEKK
jgi:putative membrane protein